MLISGDDYNVTLWQWAGLLLAFLCPVIQRVMHYICWLFLGENISHQIIKCTRRRTHFLIIFNLLIINQHVIFIINDYGEMIKVEWRFIWLKSEQVSPYIFKNK